MVPARTAGDNRCIRAFLRAFALILRHAFIPLDNGRLAHLCGALDQHLRAIEAALGVAIARRNESFRVEGSKAAGRFDFILSTVPGDLPLGDYLGALRPEGEPVTLELAPEVAWIAEEHPVDSVVELEGGRLRVVLPVGDERWLIRVLLRTGDAVTVLDRPDLVERLRTTATTALAAYAGTS